MESGGQSLDHWRGVIWNPGIEGQQDICVCYDCLCLMVLFRDVVLLLHMWTNWPAWTRMIPGNYGTIAWELGSLRHLIQYFDVDCLCIKMNQQFKEVQGDVIMPITDRVENNRLQRCAGGGGSSLVHCTMGRIPFRTIGRFSCGRVSVSRSDWLHGCAASFISAGSVRIGYIRNARSVRYSIDAAPVTGSLVFFHTFDRLHRYCAAECASSLNCYDFFFGRVDLCWTKTMEGSVLVEDCAGVMFGVKLFLCHGTLRRLWWILILKVWSLWGQFRTLSACSDVGQMRRKVEFCRDAMPAVYVLVSDSRGLDQNFHDVTIVDMGVESAVSIPELSLLREQWPPTIFKHMGSLQQELEVMRADAEKTFRQARPGPCRYCGMVIRCDMYRHVAKFHLDLTQLWRCPVSWCTVWKGTPQDCMDHVRGAHDVLWIAKKANMEKFIPPWTVCRQMWLDSLKAGHSGISTDIMLFTDPGLSLTHHCRIHRHGLPHIAFW